jgi:hypothetical protein
VALSPLNLRPADAAADENVSRRSIGLSASRRGATISASSTGRRRASLGWRGLFWRRL